jgi:hypothetical protein
MIPNAPPHSPLHPIRAAALAVPVICIAAAAAGATPGHGLQCLAGPPGVMLSLSGGTTRIDYLGDGVFALDPAMPAPGFGFSRHTVATAAGPLPLFLSREPCEIFGVRLPVRVEVSLPANGGLRPVSGCCREVAP